MDFFSGKVKLEIPGDKIADNVFAGQGVEIAPSAVINGPVFIGNNCKVDGDTRIESFSALGDDCIISDRTTIKRSILWNGAYIGRGAALRGAILGSRVQVHDGAGVYEGAVVGSDSVVRENGVIKPDIKIWPNKVIEAGTTVQTSIVWGTRCPKKVFGLNGVSGLANVEMTPEFAARMAAAFASVTGGEVDLAVSSDSYPASQMIKEAVVSGMQSAGAVVFDLGNGITPMHRFAVRELGLDGGIHVKVGNQKKDLVTMVFINKNGGNISRGNERKVENVFLREDFKRVDFSRVPSVKRFRDIVERYNAYILSIVDRPALEKRNINLVMAYDRINLEHFIVPVCEKLGIKITNIDHKFGDGAARSWNAYREMLPQLSEAVVKSGSTAGVMMDPNGDNLILVDEMGRMIEDDMLTALFALVLLKSGAGPVIAPVTASEAIEKIADRYSGKVIRTKTAIQDLVELMLVEEKQHKDMGQISQFLMQFDALVGFLSIIGFICKWELSLGQLINEIPIFYTKQKTVSVPWENKGTVIREIIEKPDGSEMELLYGVKVFYPNGWALVLPDPEEPLCRVFSEGASMEVAESLADFYIERIQKIINK